MKLKFLIIVIIIGIFSATDARGAIAPLISYQAKLTDISNQPVPDGNYNFRFRIYNVLSGGTALWTEEYTGGNKVLVSSGLFSVLLGSITPLTAVDFNQNPLYLSIEVGKTSDPPEWDGEMSPRKRISSAPYAFNADKLDGIDSSALVQTSRQIISGTGLVGGGDLSADRTISLANTTVTAGSYGSASQVAVFTVDAQGRLTAASNTDIAIAASAITSGTLSLARGGTGADLSTTGGPNQFVKQTTLGGPLTVGPILDADVPDDITLTNITQITNRAITDTTGTLPVSRGGTGLTSIGAAHQLLGTNAAATGLEYKNLASLLTAGTNISISGTTNATIATVANPTFSTSVTTPILQTSSGALTFQTGASVGADDIVFLPAGAEKMRILENGDLFFEKGVNDVTLQITAPAASRTYTIPDFGANVSLVGSNRAINTTLPLSGGGDLSADRTLSIGGLSSLGTANYVVGVNNTASGWEYKNIVGTASEIDVTHTAGQVQIGLVDPLAVAKGGTGVTALSDILGTANQITVTNGTGRVIGGNVTLSLPQDIHTGSTPTFAGLNLSGLTSGSILFAGSGGAISQDNTNLFWDNTNKRLGIGTTGPTQLVDIVQKSGGGDAVLLVRPTDQASSGILRLQTNNPVGAATGGYADLQFYDGSTLGFRFLAAFGNVAAARYGGFIAYQDRDGNKLPLRFSTTDAGGSQQTALFIQAGQAAGTSGNVGIGTTGPNTKLEIRGGDITLSHANLGSWRYGGKLSLIDKLKGRQINNNPDFLEGISGYSIYDNGGSGSISFSLLTDDTAPNTAGRVLQIDHANVGTPSPGWGGFKKAFSRCSGTAVGECYREGNRIVYRIWAKIPSGYTINFVSNAYGTGGTYNWLSSQAGTGQWEEYVAIQQIGSGGTFSTTGYWYITGGTRPFTWYVASVDIIDIDQPADVDRASELNIGYKKDVFLGSGNLLTTGATYLAVDGGNVGIGTTAPSAKLTVQEAESTILTDFTQAVSKAGILIQTNYTNGAYTPGIFWVTANNFPTKPKAGLWMSEHGTGSRLYLGTSNAYATGITNQALTINEDGNVGIGTTAPNYLLHVFRSTDGDVAGFTDANGTCTINPTNTALICSSDIRAKEVISSLSGSLEKIMALNPIVFRWKNQTDNTLHFGFGAQEVEEIIPELVLTASDGSKSLNYIGFTPFLVNAIQELSKQIEGLKLSVNQSSSAPALLVLNSYLENLKMRLVITEDDKIEVKKLAIDELEIRENLDIKKGGITLYDESTGQPYCVMIKDGQLINIAGKCQDQNQVKQTQNESQNLQNQDTNLQIDTNSQNINEQSPNTSTDENSNNQNASLQDTNAPNIETQDTN